jgi:hypothetical protein
MAASAALALLNRNKHDRVVTDLSTHVVVVRSPLVDGFAGLPLYNIDHHAQIHRDQVSVTTTPELIQQLQNLTTRRAELLHQLEDLQKIECNILDQLMHQKPCSPVVPSSRSGPLLALPRHHPTPLLPRPAASLCILEYMQPPKTSHKSLHTCTTLARTVLTSNLAQQDAYLWATRVRKTWSWPTPSRLLQEAFVHNN